MIEVTPGFNYFLAKGGMGMLHFRLSAINIWMDENDMGDRVRSKGETVADRTYIFEHEEDAVAFKLRFGI